MTQRKGKTRKRKGRNLWTHSIKVTVCDPKGLHGRPLALLAAHLKVSELSANLGVRKLPSSAGATVDLGSTQRLRALALLGVGGREGDELEFVARGRDAEEALELVRDVLDSLSHTPTEVEVSLELADLLGSDEEACAFYRRVSGEVVSSAKPGRGTLGRVGMLRARGVQLKNTYKAR